MHDGTSKVLTINDPDSLNNDAGVTSVAISPDGRHVAARYRRQDMGGGHWNLGGEAERTQGQCL